MLNVLHIASFTGNIGDNANHNGTWSTLSDVLNKQISIEKSEIRKYYQNYNKSDKKRFDDDFIHTANQKDIVIVGGGSFFDPWITNSRTGTTIDISNSQIDAISTPIIFHGLGFIPNQLTSDSIVKKFEPFLSHLINSDHCLVSVRNDGSQRHIRKLLGDSYADQIDIVPDGGFFVETNNCTHPEIPSEGVTIGINLVSDMKYRRFPGMGEYNNYQRFIMEFSSCMNSILETNPSYNILFIPHIYSDLTAISDVLQQMDVFYRRTRVTTAPYLHGMGQENYIFDIYDCVDLALGLRFHANVCPIGLNTPTVGLINGHPKVGDLYSSLNLSERCVSVHNNSFATELSDHIQNSIANTSSIKNEYSKITDSLRENMVNFHKKIGTYVN